MGHELEAWWVGSSLDIDSARTILPGHSATTVQVTGGVLGYMMKNRNEGFCFPEEIPHEPVLDIPSTYSEPLVSFKSDWNPLKNRSALGMFDYLDRFGELADGPDAACFPKDRDKWQLQTIKVQPQGNTWTQKTKPGAEGVEELQSIQCVTFPDLYPNSDKTSSSSDDDG